jgi:glycosyltransferase involved in cell wall biosynthesis
MPPRGFSGGIAGHSWEQFVLPALAGGRLLFSPANMGPILYSSQVVVIHDISPIDHPEWFSKRYALWYRIMTPALVRRCRLVITVSRFTGMRLIKKLNVDPDKIRVVHEAAGPDFYPRSRREVEQALRLLAIPAGKYILAFASSNPRKNLARILAAWASVVDHVPGDIWLLLVGNPGHSRIFGRGLSFAIPPRVHVAGFIPDKLIPAIYSGALGLLFPSLYEGFGLPALEAMACGAPVIVSRSSSLPEVVSDAGILVDPMDVKGLAQVIELIASDPDLRTAMKHRGIARAKEFSWNRAAESIRNLLIESASI